MVNPLWTKEEEKITKTHSFWMSAEFWEASEKFDDCNILNKQQLNNNKKTTNHKYYGKWSKDINEIK